MSRDAWTITKNQKNFNVHVYRRGLILLIISLCISVILGLLMFYYYVLQPERNYYASSGVTFPVQLKAMLEPNLSPDALLPPDPPTDVTTRVIPQ